jgi:cation diffusion facilitator family transporter
LGTSPKEQIALTSIIASVFVTVMKLVVGFFTQSLGVQSEALHSGIDLIAVTTTYFAVRKADMPPDSEHLYGHGKAENLASLIETILLLVITVWISYEAYERFIQNTVPDVNIYSIIVMLSAIGIDFTRSRALSRTAKKYRSQALGADAVHFSTDLISSTVVIIGLVLMILNVPKVDSIAAIGVVVVILVAAYRLGKKSINTLMDRAPEGLVKLVTDEARNVEGVEKIGQVRLRESGARTFIDITVFIDKVLPLELAHGVTDRLSRRIQSVIPGSDVIVHAEPLSMETAELVAKIRGEAANFPEIKNIHNILVSEVNHNLHIDFHMELEGTLSLIKAHDLASELEARIQKLDTSIVAISSHVEPIDSGTYNGVIDQEVSSRLKIPISKIIESFPEVKSFHEIEINRINGKFKANIHCMFKSDITVNNAHLIATEIERTIKLKLKEIEVVSIHLEPEF